MVLERFAADVRYFCERTCDRGRVIRVPIWHGRKELGWTDQVPRATITDVIFPLFLLMFFREVNTVQYSSNEDGVTGNSTTTRCSEDPSPPLVQRLQ